VALIAGFAAALERRQRLLAEAPQAMQQLRNRLLEQLLDCPGFSLSGPDPLKQPEARLPHHISLLVRSDAGEPLPGRAMVQQLWNQGFAISSGSACRSLGDGRSAVLSAMGYDAGAAASGIRISLGDWHQPADLIGLPEALLAARAELSA
jgi:cysteine desulfurase